MAEGLALTERYQTVQRITAMTTARSLVRRVDGIVVARSWSCNSRGIKAFDGRQSAEVRVIGSSLYWSTVSFDVVNCLR